MDRDFLDKHKEELWSMYLDKATFPEIPEKHKYAFLCGLLDSDGCLRKTNKDNTLIVQWVGHPAI